jgi:aminodeoxyfutalosine deaminase
LATRSRHPGFYLADQDLKERALAAGAQPHFQCAHGSLPSFAVHPLRRYFDAGLLVTLNSDDPAFFGSDLANEYLLAHTQQGFTREELRQLAANSIRASFLPESEKAKWQAQIERTR